MICLYLRRVALASCLDPPDCAHTIAYPIKKVKPYGSNPSHLCHSRESGNPVSKPIGTVSGFPIKSGMTFWSCGNKPKKRGCEGLPTAWLFRKMA